MNILLKRAILILMLVPILIVGCNNKVSNGPIIGKVEGKSLNLSISLEKVQEGLNSLLSPSGQELIMKTVGIIEYQDKYFLKITGHSYQKCMIPLKEQNGILYEDIASDIPIIICSGCDDGCEPVLLENGWYCSEGCAECVKSTSVSDYYIFE